MARILTQNVPPFLPFLLINFYLSLDKSSPPQPILPVPIGTKRSPSCHVIGWSHVKELKIIYFGTKKELTNHHKLFNLLCFTIVCFLNTHTLHVWQHGGSGSYPSLARDDWVVEFLVAFNVTPICSCSAENPQHYSLHYKDCQIQLDKCSKSSHF